MTECLFCRIIAGEIPADFVYQDDKVVVFRDIKPAAPVHVLIVPREHISDAMVLAEHEACAELTNAMFQVAVSAATILKVSGSGFRLINNCGADGGQTVMHVHMHLLGGRHLGERLL